MGTRVEDQVSFHFAAEKRSGDTGGRRDGECTAQARLPASSSRGFFTERGQAIQFHEAGLQGFHLLDHTHLN